MSQKAYSQNSRYKPGDLLSLWKSQRRFVKIAQEIEILINEESQWLSETEMLYLKTLKLTFENKKNVIK